MGNDPLNATDPTGEAIFFIPVAIFIAKEIAGEVFEQTTGLPAPTVKGIGKRVGKEVARELAERRVKQNAADARGVRRKP